MTLSIVALIALIFLVYMIIRGQWLVALLVIIFIAYSGSQVAGELRWLWKNIETQKITL